MRQWLVAGLNLSLLEFLAQSFESLVDIGKTAVSQFAMFL